MRYKTKDEKIRKKDKRLLFNIRWNSIARWANSAAACDCLLRFIRSDTITVVFLYKAELLQSSHRQELKNKSDSEEDYWDRNQEAEDRRWETRNKNLNSVYCHDKQELKNEDRGKNKNLSRTKADKILNKSQSSVHWQQEIIHDVTWDSAAAEFKV